MQDPQSLLDLEGENIIVAKQVEMRGNSGVVHSVDVYYEFEKAGVRHRVAIECKNVGRAIELGKMRDFTTVVADCPGVIGVFVAANGYQDGAKRLADAEGILALTMDELPTLSYLLGLRLEQGTIPDEKTIGAPFWTLYELEDGKLNGAPYGSKHGNDIYSILFFSKKQAITFMHAMSLEKSWVVRGLSQLHLRNFILTVDSLAGRYTLFQTLVNEKGETVWGGVEIARADLIAEYCVGEMNLPKEPFVMPSRRKYVRP